VHPRILRIIDANVNRISEGLRVLEDIARFIVEDVSASRQLKTIRHQLNQLVISIGTDLIENRDSEGDIGSQFDLVHEHKDLSSIVRANAKRVQEGIRVLEEISKLPEFKSILITGELKKSRYAVYSAEKTLVARLLNIQKGDK